MDPQFWHERWELNEIGFHQPHAHPWLSEHWPKVFPGTGQVFIPLCGKSLDMLWLRQQGHSVLGVELSPLAVASFFAEQSLPVDTRQMDGFQASASDGIEILCGDFFDLQAKHLARAQAVYDRAALIALPNGLQARYAAHLLDILPHRPPILLVTLEYDPAEMDGPPFSTSGQTVEELFGRAYQIECLSSKAVLEESPGLKNRGLSSLTENAYRLVALD